MKQHITLKDRKELETKMAAVFDEKIRNLSTELQQILIDDMVTAFENRLNVLNCAYSNMRQQGGAMKKNTYH
ncbi:MAG: hypothetical protein NWF09_00115 [Candidatus Bathyarchaeota archaeon]|nr:hypothetical protein [Candidatus Bathyarchaeota archaeon]